MDRHIYRFESMRIGLYFYANACQGCQLCQDIADYYRIP